MVVSHDCHLDKEANHRARSLMKEFQLGEDEAFAIAEDDDTLDRHVVVSPIVSTDALVDPSDRSRRDLLARGRLLGYYPLEDADRLGLSGATVDLGLRATVDRLTLTARLVSLTDAARIQLRCALARIDSLRTPDIGHELDLAVGQRVVKVLRPDAKRPTVVLVLEDGAELELLPRPADIPLGGPRRGKVPRNAKPDPT